MDNKSCIKASINNLIFKTLYILTALIALSVGLYFYYAIPGTAGYGVGVAMFVVTALVAVIGEITFWCNCKRIKEIKENNN